MDSRQIKSAYCNGSVKAIYLGSTLIYPLTNCTVTIWGEPNTTDTYTLNYTKDVSFTYGDDGTYTVKLQGGVFSFPTKLTKIKFEGVVPNLSYMETTTATEIIFDDCTFIDDWYLQLGGGAPIVTTSISMKNCPTAIITKVQDYYNNNTGYSSALQIWISDTEYYGWGRDGSTRYWTLQTT